MRCLACRRSPKAGSTSFASRRSSSGRFRGRRSWIDESRLIWPYIIGDHVFSPADSAGVSVVLLQLVGPAVAAGRQLHFLLDGNRRRLPSAADASRLQVPAVARAHAGDSWRAAICRSRPPAGSSCIGCIISIPIIEPDPHTPHGERVLGPRRLAVHREPPHDRGRDVSQVRPRHSQRSASTCGSNGTLNYFWVYVIHAVLFFVVGLGVGYLLRGTLGRAATRSACSGCCGASSIARSSPGT